MGLAGPVEEPSTAFEVLVARLVADHGGMPERAFVNGGFGWEEASVEEALEFHRVNDGILSQAASADGIAHPSDDEALAILSPFNVRPCEVAVHASAYTYIWFGQYAGALAVEGSDIAVEAPPVTCSRHEIRTWYGDLSARPTGGADFGYVCANAGSGMAPQLWYASWADGPCKWGLFDRASVHGRVGARESIMCSVQPWCTGIATIFAGVPMNDRADPHATASLAGALLAQNEP